MERPYAEQKFKELYGHEYTKSFKCPSRIVLAGDHLDYNGGCVISTAIDLYTKGYVYKNLDNRGIINVFSTAFQDDGITSINMYQYFEKDNKWSDYVKGVIKEYMVAYNTMSFIVPYQRPRIKFGLDILIDSEVPIGAGLSSSASLELLIARILQTYINIDRNVTDKELIDICHRAENNFIGVNCGKLDYTTIAYNKRDKVMLYNAGDTNGIYGAITNPLHIDTYYNQHDMAILLLHTNVSRHLAQSKYNIIVEECKAALNKLKLDGVPVYYLCDVKRHYLKNTCVNIFSVLKDFNPNLYDRIRYCVNESERVMQMLMAKTTYDIKAIMDESQYDLTQLYRVSCEEINFIIRELKTNEFVKGAKMTGGGFGGSIVCFCPQACIQSIVDALAVPYKEQFNKNLTFNHVHIVNGLFE